MDHICKKICWLTSDIFLISGIFISIFSPIALVTDILALKGLRQWKRGFMIPWLILYGILIALAFAVAITELYHRGIRWPLLLLAFCSLLVFSRWRHLSLQYKVTFEVTKLSNPFLTNIHIIYPNETGKSYLLYVFFLF